jgi:hypothetical protein
MRWPDRDRREAFEIAGFIAAYARLPGAVQLEVVAKGDRPDFIVRDVLSRQEYGVEVTSVYLDDRSVPDIHMREQTGAEQIPLDEAELEQYCFRLAGSILNKICKAREGYDRSRSLILAIYVNEYISLWMPLSKVDAFVKRYDDLFDAMAPFSQVVFWNLPDEGVLRATPRAGASG